MQPDDKQLLMSRQDAAASLGMSLSHFKRHVQPFIACVYVGQLRMYRPEDLRAWRDDRACTPKVVA